MTQRMIFLIGGVAFILILTPSNIVLSCWNEVRTSFKRDSLLKNGEDLYLWLDSFGPHEMSLHLSKRKKMNVSYKYFPELIDEMWLEVQRRGGPLLLMIKAVKQFLRDDLKRTRREKGLVGQAFGQSILMYTFIWLYLVAFKNILETQFSLLFLLSLLAFQVVGVAGFYFLIALLRKKHFRALEFFSRQMMELYLIRFKGELSLARLENATFRLDKREKCLRERMAKVLVQWKSAGRCQESHIDFLVEELSYMTNDKEQLFLEQLKIIFFLWALVFIVPCLFAVSIFGLSELLVV